MGNTGNRSIEPSTSNNISLYKNDQDTDIYYSIIDTDPSFDNVIGIISNILDQIDNHQWTIGSLLVFLRFKTQDRQIEYIEGDGTAETLAKNLINWSRANGIRLESKEAKDFLHWKKLDLKRRVVLYNERSIIVYEKIDEVLTDLQFKNYIDLITTQLKNKLDEKTAWAYYITALTFPVAKRLPHRSWTYHFEWYNYTVARLKAIDSEAQQPEKAEFAQQLIETLDDDDITISQLRQMTRDQRDANNGYPAKVR